MFNPLLTFCFVIPFISLVKTNVTISTYDKNLSRGLNISDFVRSLGYPFEVHENIQTEDGYLLNVHRIPHGKNNKDKNQQKRGVVLFMHGLLAVSGYYLVNGVNKSLPYLMADRGYDVWLGNARGTTYCIKHAWLDTESPQFWDFSWHEIGYYDIPALIHYILKHTNQPNLFFVGHSQGATSFFAMSTTRPEINKFIKLMIGLAPGVYYGTQNGYLSETITSEINNLLNDTAYALNLHSVNTELFLGSICGILRFVMNFETCGRVTLMTGGLNLENVKLERVPFLLNTMPDSSSVKQLLHYLQLQLTGKYKQFSFLPAKNMEIYGTPYAPLYDLKKATIPVAAFFASGDVFVTPQNGMRLVRDLPNVKVTKILGNNFAHLDFVFHENIRSILYDDILKIMDDY